MRPKLLLLLAILTLGCKTNMEKLPILGEQQIVNGDTIYHTISEFNYLNQDSAIITKATFADKIYVADLFFTSCPTICPKVTAQMLRLQEEFSQDTRVNFLSLSVDYRKDSVPILKRYADKVGINGERWHLVQLQKDQIERVANEYFGVAYEDASIPGGFDHSGRLMLIDKEGRIRAYCDGQDPTSVDAFIPKIRQLLSEG